MRKARQLQLLAVSSGVLAATISFGAIASAAGPGGQHRRDRTTEIVRQTAAIKVTTSSAGTGLGRGRGSATTMTGHTKSTPHTRSPRQIKPPITAATTTTTKAPTTTSKAATTTTKPPTTTTTPTTTKPPTTTTTTPSASTSTSLLEGAYVGAANVDGLAGFAATTKTSLSIASDAVPTSGGWAGMDGSGGTLAWEFAHGWTGTPYTLSLAVPIIPTDASGNPVGTLAAGATGAYNSSFVTLAQTLVAAGESNAYLRLGWEFDGGWYTWSATTPTAEANYASYFQQIVTAMRSVAGEHFRFVWNPTAAAFTDGYGLSAAYPGNAYVDYIGLDDYDQTWVTPQTAANEWNETTLPNLVAAHQFAAAHAKPLAVDEWGLSIRDDGHGLGDDPLFVTNFIAWMKNPANNVAFETYYDFDDGGQADAITDGNFPNSLAAFSSAMG
jgi:beta-mannanase